MILRLTQAEVLPDLRLRVRFNNGAEGVVDVEPMLEGPVFEPLRDPSRFAEGRFDPICGTVAWPNGADFAPEALLAGLDARQAA